jgi:hypothetical protein
MRAPFAIGEFDCILLFVVRRNANHRPFESFLIPEVVHNDFKIGICFKYDMLHILCFDLGDGNDEDEMYGYKPFSFVVWIC